MTKISITSTTVGEVSVSEPSIPFKMSWPSKGTTRQVDKEIIEQLMYLPGFEYMINSGMLYIEDMAAKKELGIEPEDATEPVKVIVLSDMEKKKYLKDYSLEKFKENIKKLSLEQVNDLADYAIEHKIADFDKCEIITKICHKDIIQAIRLAKANKEA